MILIKNGKWCYHRNDKYVYIRICIFKKHIWTPFVKRYTHEKYATKKFYEYIKASKNNSFPVCKEIEKAYFYFLSL